jgi:uroporphyrinogen-III synthase
VPKSLILVPRPAPHLPGTLDALAGLPTLPLALSHPQPLAISLPSHITAIILTSRIGVPTLSPLPNLPTWCVGGCTAIAAKAAGFQVVYTGTNNAVTMATAILSKNLPPQHFLHPHGDHAGTTWYSLLRKAGHTITPVLAYHTGRIAALPSQILTAHPTHTLLFSAGSAQHLANLYKNANIPLTSTALCLSPAVAQVAAAHWPQVRVASQPTLAAMVQLARTTTK